MPRPTAPSETQSHILDVAEQLVQTRGFNAFSYADIALTLHVTKASLHYHFPSKAKLGERLIERYRAAFLAALDRIDGTCGNASEKLSAYVGIYAEVLAHDRMCLCGMLAAKYETLPSAMQEGIRGFFATNEAWLADMLLCGRDNGQLAFAGPPVETARLLVAMLEGAMLLARSHQDPSRMRSASDRMLANLGVVPAVPAETGALSSAA